MEVAGGHLVDVEHGTGWVDAWASSEQLDSFVVPDCIEYLTAD